MWFKHCKSKGLISWRVGLRALIRSTLWKLVGVFWEHFSRDWWSEPRVCRHTLHSPVHMLLPHILPYSAHRDTRTIYKYTHSSTVVDFMHASSIKALHPPISLHCSLISSLTLFAVLCFFCFYCCKAPFYSAFRHFFLPWGKKPPPPPPFSLSLSRIQTLNLSLCLSLGPCFLMHLPVTERDRDLTLPSSSPDPPPPLAPLLHLSSSRFLTVG